MIKYIIETCDTCQRNKIRSQRKYGKIPTDDRQRDEPWQDVHVDLVGPWSVDVIHEETNNMV